MRSFLVLILVAGFLSPAEAQVRPEVGVWVPELAELDDRMQFFMDKHDLGAGVLALEKDGTVLYHRAFGWSNRERTKPIGIETLMRVASVTKSFTAAAIRNLVASGDIDLDSRVFSLDEPEVGLLPHLPFGGTFDPRLKEITVEHLLQHRGGWDTALTPDLTYREIQISEEMEVPAPPNQDQTLEWILSHPLDHDPGTTEAYSNTGFFILGLIVEEVTGQNFHDYLGDQILDPIGVRRDHWHPGRTLWELNDRREPWYDYNGAREHSVFYPTQFIGRPYGAWHHEVRKGQGSLVASPLAILRMLQTYHINGLNIGGPRPAPGPWDENLVGGFSGTASLAHQRGDGINFSTIFNQSADSFEILDLINGLLDGGTLTFPTEGVTDQWMPANWVYMQWPYAYSIAGERWRYFSTTSGNSSWAANLSTGSWGLLGERRGWVYWNYPYLYDSGTSTWHYFSQTNVQYVQHLGEQVWRKISTY